jgi:hypothetical protein
VVALLKNLGKVKDQIIQNKDKEEAEDMSPIRRMVKISTDAQKYKEEHEKH